MPCGESPLTPLLFKATVRIINMNKQQIENEINEIEMAMACDDSVSSYSFAFSQAEERLKYLKKLLKS